MRFEREKNLVSYSRRRKLLNLRAKLLKIY